MRVQDVAVVPGVIDAFLLTFLLLLLWDCVAVTSTRVLRSAMTACVTT